MEQSEKIYCNAAIVKTKTFATGGEIQKISVRVDEMIAFLTQHADNGWVNLNMQKRKQPGGPKGDITHSVSLDTWKPQRQQEQPTARQAAPTGNANSDNIKKDDLPF